jgi:3-phytase
VTPLRRLLPVAVLAALHWAAVAADQPPVQPRVITAKVKHDADDPAIWIHPTNPQESLILGTDKHSDGGLTAFNLGGHPVREVRGLKRPNNVDVAQGLKLDGKPTDIAVLTERGAQRLRVFRLPDLAPLENGGLTVFGGDTQRAPMGIALYRRPADDALFAIVSGKSGPKEGYLWQYRLTDDGSGRVRMVKVREFGRFQGGREIEAIAVDAALGFVYYSDEGFGVHKYLADPEAPGAEKELAVFATTGFKEDHEGISIYARSDGTGYLLISDQQADLFRIYPREGLPGRPHEHPQLSSVKLSTHDSDGSDLTTAVLHPRFPNGLLVAMSADRTYHYYSWRDIALAAGLPVTSPAARNP